MTSLLLPLVLLIGWIVTGIAVLRGHGADSSRADWSRPGRRL